MSDTTPPLLSLREAIDALASPCSLERYAHATGAAMLVVDLGRSCILPGSAMRARARTNLAQLPCPSIATHARGLSRQREAWARAFDVALDEDEQLASIANTIAAHPIAAATLVQLLRQTALLSIHHGLIVESLAYSTLQGGPEFAAWLRDHERPQAARPDGRPAVAMLRDGARLQITLNRPERRNAFSAEMRDGLVEALQLVDSDTGIEEVILRGAGEAFCSGGDLAEFGTLPDPASAHALRSTRSPARLLARCAGRVRSELHGACVGAGIELPAFTTRVRATRDARFWLPEVPMGLVPGAGGSVSLPRRIGRQRTAYLALSQRHIDAESALRWGLVDELVDERVDELV